MKKSNYISALIFGFGILLGLTGILLPIFVYKNKSIFYVPKIIDSRSFKFTKDIQWDVRFENKSSDLYLTYRREIVNDVSGALGGNTGVRDKRQVAASASKNYEINNVELLSLNQSIDNEVVIFIAVIYVTDNEGNIPSAKNEAKKLTILKDISNIKGADTPTSFCDVDNGQTTISPTTALSTSMITSTNMTVTEMSTRASTTKISSSPNTPTRTTTSSSPIVSAMLSTTTITPFIPLDPIGNCSQNGQYVFQDLVFVYELNNDGNNKIQESEGIQKFISDILLNPDHFTFNKTKKERIQAMKLLILPYPNPMHFYSTTPSFNSINSISDLKILFTQQLSIANSNVNESMPETGVCFYLSNLNNQRRGLPTTLILFSKNVPLDYGALSTCLTELRKTEMNIILIGVGTWNQTEFKSLCEECYYKIDVIINNNNQKIIAEKITNSLRAICSIDMSQIQ